MTADVVAFLRAAHEEIERVALAATGEAWVDSSGMVEVDEPFPEREIASRIGFSDTEPMDAENRAHIALHDPRSALARVQAERAILQEHGNGGPCEECWNRVLDEPQRPPCDVVEWLAYGHRHTISGWRAEWAPEGVAADA